MDLKFINCPCPIAISLIFAHLFLQLSNGTTNQLILPRVVGTDTRLANLINLIYKKAKQSPPKLVEVTHKNTQKLQPNNDKGSNKFVLVGFTGGKDSAYMLINLINKGFNPIPVYIDGINRCFPSEKDRVIEICSKLKLNYIMPKIQITGSMPFLSNPLKNGLILGIMFDLGCHYNINKFALGNHSHTKIGDTQLDATISDSVEFILACCDYAKYFIDDLKYYQIDVPIYKIYNQLHQNKLLNCIQSCISTHRYQKYLRQQNIKKYNIIDALENRCYSCYKCCQEHLILEHLELVNNNAELVKHCLKILRNKWSYIVLPNKPLANNCNDQELLNLITQKY